MKTATNSSMTVTKRPIHPKVTKVLTKISTPNSPPVATRDAFQPIQGTISQFKVTIS